MNLTFALKIQENDPIVVVAYDCRSTFRSFSYRLSCCTWFDYSSRMDNQSFALSFSTSAA